MFLVGFGINFAKSSVFFTVNGNLVHETAKNSHKAPITNIKNLRATLSLIKDDVRVNMGSDPFKC